MPKSPAYTAGRQAKRDGLSWEANPYLGEPGRAGIRRYTDEASGTDWSLGYRDEADEQAGPAPQLRNFVRRVRCSGRDR